MSTFTAGPWYGKALGNIADQYGVSSEANGKTVAICGWVSAEETQANAKLIAAAPDLLEACQRVEALLTVIREETGGTEKGIADRLRELRAAIDQATR